MSVMENDEHQLACPVCSEVWSEANIDFTASLLGLTREEVTVAFKTLGCPAFGLPHMGPFA